MLEDLIVPYVRSAGVRGHGRTAREALVDKLNKFLRTHGSEVLHPSDLQRLLNLGPRALRQFFQDNYGMSVGRFLRLRRLNNAYRDLRDGRYESRPVTEVAIKHGFYDLGRFASAYEDVFAELPSETARRSRRR
jgi:transcriptional regulator GlxA family with amidase domain